MAYVYLHTRLDTNEIFYVGIGKSDTDNFKRSRSIKQRNFHWKNVVNKAGFRVDVVYRNVSWEKAIETEIKLIKLYGRSDLGLGNLVNMTDGGEGALGKKMLDVTKKKLSEFNKGKKHTEETKKKMSENSKGFKHSEETKKKMSESSIGSNNSFFGKIHSDETKLKISDTSKGRQNMLGKKHTEDTKNKMKKSHMDRNFEIFDIKSNQLIHFINLGLSTKEISIEMNLSVGTINRLKRKIKI